MCSLVNRGCTIIYMGVLYSQNAYPDKRFWLKIAYPDKLFVCNIWYFRLFYII